MTYPKRLFAVLLPGLLLLSISSSRAIAAKEPAKWFDFVAGGMPAAASPINLRHLNEPVAGAGGYVTQRDGHFVLGSSGRPVRFWGVNGPSHAAQTPEQLRREARLLASYGVNLVRVHGAIFDESGRPDPAKIQRAIAIAEAMKAEGIYVLYSIYFPLWLKPKPDDPLLKGYSGNQAPFATLMFNEDFQARYREWWRALLLTPSATTGRRLVDEPAVMGLEIQNEDSYLFWTFNYEAVPEKQLAVLEGHFGDWLKRKYGSETAALKAWGRDYSEKERASGRIRFRSLHAMAHEKTAEDKDNVAFLVGSQRQFYEKQRDYLKSLGYPGLITCSNWTTASPEVLGPLEKYTYTLGDFIDRHGYFSSRARGEGAEWSVRPGHTYIERSALRFEAEEKTRGHAYVNPVMDTKYAGLPSMISETTWTRPNRYRTEAPLYFATYGALQDSDAIIHFAFDGSTWSVKPNFWMQPWTLMSPVMMGQFPAAALIYRQGLVRSGEILARIHLNVADLFALKGTPLPQEAAFDELRARDLVAGATTASGATLIDPLIHYAGQTRVSFGPEAARTEVEPLGRLVDRNAKTVKASNGEMFLDYGKGVLTINAAAAQGVLGNLRAAGSIDLGDIQVESSLDVGAIMLVSLDGAPVQSSSRLLLQVMSEEQSTGFETEDAADGAKLIKATGRDPWQIKGMTGSVVFKQGAAQLKITSLDHAGNPQRPLPLEAGKLTLAPDVLYYSIIREPVGAAPSAVAFPVSAK